NKANATAIEAKIRKLDLVPCLGTRAKRLDRVAGRIGSLIGSIVSVETPESTGLGAFDRRIQKSKNGVDEGEEADDDDTHEKNAVKTAMKEIDNDVYRYILHIYIYVRV
ncbi:hypothetical protein TorRG33x02_265780, partial [Trema orientale]